MDNSETHVAIEERSLAHYLTTKTYYEAKTGTKNIPTIQTDFLKPSNIIGSRINENGKDLIIFSYPLCGRKNYRKRHETLLTFYEVSEAQKTKSIISNIIGFQMRKVLIVLNPYGGAKKALQYLDNVVKPMFSQAEISFDVLHTRYSGHAIEIGRDFDKTKYTDLCCLSGDGTMHEIINGISQQSDGTKIEDICIGILNGGTANCLVAALLERRGERGCSFKKVIWNATFAFIRGAPKLVDLLRVNYLDKNLYLCQSLSWGLICDVEFESEWLRTFGSSRYSVYAIKHIILNKGHKGSIHYIPEDISNTSEAFQKYLERSPKEQAYHQKGN